MEKVMELLRHHNVLLIEHPAVFYSLEEAFDRTRIDPQLGQISVRVELGICSLNNQTVFYNQESPLKGMTDKNTVLLHELSHALLRRGKVWYEASTDFENELAAHILEHKLGKDLGIDIDLPFVLLVMVPKAIGAIITEGVSPWEILKRAFRISRDVEIAFKANNWIPSGLKVNWFSRIKWEARRLLSCKQVNKRLAKMQKLLQGWAS